MNHQDIRPMLSETVLIIIAAAFIALSVVATMCGDGDKGIIELLFA